MKTDNKFNEEIVELAEVFYPVIEKLAHGSEKAITYTALMPIFGEVCYHKYGYGLNATKRKLRKACKAMLRVLDKPVITGQSGVFVAETQESIDAFIADEQSRICELSKNILAAKFTSPVKKKVADGYFSFMEK